MSSALPGESAGVMYPAHGMRTAIVAPDRSDAPLALRVTVELDAGDEIAFVFSLPSEKGRASASLIGLVAEFERSCVEVLRLEAISAGIGRQEAEQKAREYARRARIEGRRQAEQELARAAATIPTCVFCRKRVALIHDGVRLCSRHAEELGVRPHGKIGSES